MLKRISDICYVCRNTETPVMKADYQKASSFLTSNEARVKACRGGIKNYKIVKTF